jgi:hypothetical protein
MPREIRFGSFVQAITLRQRQVSYNDLVPQPQFDEAGNELPCIPSKLKLRPIENYRLIKPYVSIRFIDQARAVVPLAIYLMLFQLLILRQGVEGSWIISAGLLSVIVGLMLFMEGLKLGLMPLGEALGSGLPVRSPLAVVLTVAFLLGVGVTFAEPAIGALKQAGQIVDIERAPYLYALLNQWAEALVLVVGAGVGLAAVLGTIRFLSGWSLKPLIYLTLAPTLLLTLYMAGDPQLSKTLALAWDCGAVTTGPVTVPLVLSLGIGIASAAGKGDSSLSGFGIVTLASLFPIMGVEILTLYLATSFTPDEIIAAAKAAPGAGETLSWYAVTPATEIISGLRAIVPLVIFLFLVMIFILREKIKRPKELSYGLILCVLGMIVFNLGLSYGLSKLGGQSGGLIPGAFMGIEGFSGSPLYDYLLGILIAVIFAWILGFGATLAEPALNALGLTVENLTNGAFKKSLLMYAVSTGVGCGIALGVLKIVYDIPVAFLIIPGYLVAVVLTIFSSEEFVNIAWDSAGVTTGPVTVPLVLAMGLGFGNALGVTEGFGILSMASIGPIIAVQVTGLWIRRKIKRRREYSELKSASSEQTLVATIESPTGDRS